MAAIITQKQIYHPSYCVELRVSGGLSLPLIDRNFPVWPDQCYAAVAPHSPSFVKHFPTPSARQSPQVSKSGRGSQVAGAGSKEFPSVLVNLVDEHGLFLIIRCCGCLLFYKMSQRLSVLVL